MAALAAPATSTIDVAGAVPAASADMRTTITITDASADGVLSLTIDGTGYTDLPQASRDKASAGVYVALHDADTMTNDAQHRYQHRLFPPSSTSGPARSTTAHGTPP